MQIGSFIELDIYKSGEHYAQKTDIIRLNCARAGIYHSCRLYSCDSMYIPYYLCPSVKNFLISKNIKLIYYHINSDFEPIIKNQENNTAILIVNYFGILSNNILNNYCHKFNNVIIDNSTAFFSAPLPNCYTVYSPRKFFGVPDGCYVIGEKAETYLSEYNKDFSADTSNFLLKRIESGCNNSYSDRMLNEKRIDESDILEMSTLTQALLSGINYPQIKEKRKENFKLACDLYKGLNLIDPTKYLDNDCVPMIYPLVIENIAIIDTLRQKEIYTGRWWVSVLKTVNEGSIESWFSKYFIPIPIDQRYGVSEINYVYEIIRSEYV